MDSQSSGEISKAADSPPSSVWGPSSWGRQFVRTEDWQLGVSDRTIVLTQTGVTTRLGLSLDSPPSVTPGLFWSSVHLTTTEGPQMLCGIANRRARRLQETFGRILADLRSEQDALDRRAHFDDAAALTQRWARDMLNDAERELAVSGWLTSEFTVKWFTARPDDSLEDLLADPDLVEHLASQSSELLEAMDLYSMLHQYVEAWNQNFRSVSPTESAPAIGTAVVAPTAAATQLTDELWTDEIFVLDAAGSSELSADADADAAAATPDLVAARSELVDH